MKKFFYVLYLKLFRRSFLLQYRQMIDSAKFLESHSRSIFLCGNIAQDYKE